MPSHQAAPSESRPFSHRATRPIPSTWPCTKWPPNSLPAVSGRSRFTRVPALISANEVRRSVSEERSAAKISPTISTMVRQQPFTAMLPDTASEAASGPACTRRRLPCTPFSSAPSRASTRPTCSMIPVNISEVSFDGEVRAKVFGVHARKFAHAKRARAFARRQARQRTAEPHQRGRVEQAHFFDEIGLERGLIEERARLEHHTQDIAAAELCEHSVQLRPPAARAHRKDLHAVCTHLFGANTRGARTGKHENIAIGGTHDLRFRAESQL